MDVKEITEAIRPEIEKRGLFIVEIKVTKDNDITITVESGAATVTLDDCEQINRAFTGMFSQDEEDYSLTVTSAGLDAAFKVEGQFRKALGSKVEVWFKGGKKLIGTLDAFDDASITLDGAVWQNNEINRVKYYIEF